MNNFLDNIKSSIVLGNKDSGKTTGFMFNELENFIVKGDNLVITDVKKEYYNNYLKMLKMKGYDVVVINFNDPKYSDNYNPLMAPYNEYLNGNIDNSIGLLQRFAEYLIGNNEDEKSLFVALSLIVFKEFKDDEINLGTVGSMLQVCMTKEFIDYVGELDYHNPIYILVNSLTLEKDFPLIVQNLRKKFNYYLVRINLLNMLSGEDNLINITDSKLAVFIMGSNLDESGDLVPLVIEEMIFKARKSGRNYDFILDNADLLNRINILDEVVSLNLKNIKITMITRDLLSLKNYYSNRFFRNINYMFEIQNGAFRFNGQTFKINMIYDRKFKEELPVVKDKLKFGDIKKFLNN